jgi:hypothetical protein
MKRTHALLISVVLGLAVILGSFAAIRSTQLSAASAAPGAGSAQIAQQNAVLSQAEAKLRAELARKPPAIPGKPTSPAGPATVVYRRAPTVVHVIHRHGGEQDTGEGGGVDD